MRNPRNPEQVSRRQKGGWATGVIADVFMANVFNYLAQPIYIVALKVDPVFFGWALGLPRVWEAITDALMGHVSDNTRTRWGRRRPFVFWGAIASGVMFALAWMPPAQASPQIIGIFFLIVALLYYTAYTVFVVPWSAMGLELTTDYYERTNVQVWKTIIQAIGGLFLGGLWWLALHLGKTDVEGVRWVGIIFGLLIACAGVVPALVCKEAEAGQHQEKIQFVKAFKQTFKNKAFLCVVGFNICVLLGVFTITSLAFYINLLYVFVGDKTAVAQFNFWGNVVYQAAGLALTPLVSVVARHLGKQATLAAGFGLVILGFGMSFWTYTPAMPYLQLVTLGLLSPGLACLWVLGPSMLADVCDLDELQTGLRREGMYSASYAWTIKAAIALTMIGSGYVLRIAGYDAALETAQPDGVVLRLRLMYMFVPMLLVAAGIFFVWLYPLSAKRAAEIREQLDVRKRATSNPDVAVPQYEK